MCFCVQKKGDFDDSPPRATLPRREQQQRQPRDQHAGENAAMNHLQGIVGEVRSAKELVQRAAQDEGEVGWFPCQQLRRVQARSVHRLRKPIRVRTLHDLLYHGIKGSRFPAFGRVSISLQGKWQATLPGTEKRRPREARRRLAPEHREGGGDIHMKPIDSAITTYRDVEKGNEGFRDGPTVQALHVPAEGH